MEKLLMGDTLAIWLGLEVLFSLSLLWRSWSLRGIAGVNTFLQMVVGGLLWIGFYALELFSSALEWKLLWNSLQYLGMAVALLYIAFILEYLGYSAEEFKWVKRVGWVLGSITVLAALTDWPPGAVHASPPRLLSSALPTLSYSYGYLVWLNIVIMSLSNIAAIILLLERFFRSSSVFLRRQLSSIILATLFPFLASIGVTLSFPGFPLWNNAPLTFLLGDIFYLVAFERYRLFNIGTFAEETYFDHMAEAALVLDDSLCLVKYNRKAQEWFDLPQDAVGKPVQAVLSVRWQGLILFLANREQEEILEFLKNKRVEAAFRVRRIPLSPLAGQYTLCLVEDVTERRRLEIALHHAEQLYGIMVEESSDGIAILQEGRFRFINTRLAYMLGYTVKEVLGEPFLRYVHDEARARTVTGQYFSSDPDDEITFSEVPLIRSDQGLIWLEVRLKRIFLDGVPAVLLFCNDISERKQREAREQAYRSSLEQRTARAELLHAIAERLNRDVAPLEALEEVLQLVSQWLSAQSSWLLFYHEQNAMQLVASYRLPRYMQQLVTEGPLALCDSLGIFCLERKTGRTCFTVLGYEKIAMSHPFSTITLASLFRSTAPSAACSTSSWRPGAI